MTLHNSYQPGLRDRIFAAFFYLFSLATIVAITGCSEEQSQPGVIKDGNARITVLTPSLLRLEYSETGQFEDRPSQLVGQLPKQSSDFEVLYKEHELVVSTGNLTLVYQRNSGPFSAQNLKITFQKSGQDASVSPTWGPLTADSNTLGGWLRGLDLIAGREAMNPGLLSKQGWTLLDDTNSALLVDEPPGYAPRIEQEGTYQDGYFFAYGLDYKKALADLSHLTGAAPLLPRRALGVWFSRYYAYSQAEWKALATKFRDEEIPLSVLSLDTDWKRPAADNICELVNDVSGARPGDPCSWNGWDWNYDIFPDPLGLLSWLDEQGIDVGLNIHPSININDPEFETVEQAGATLSEDAVGAPCALLQGAPDDPCYVFDLLDQAQIDAYFALHDGIATTGIDFWWLDWCCEHSGNSVAGLTMDTWANGLYKSDQDRRGSRWPVLSRMGGELGIPPEEQDLLGVFAEGRQTIHFTGDTCSTWELMAFVAELTIGEGAVGMPYVSHDIGSFHGELLPDAPCNAIEGSNPRMSDDMYIRWIQMGTFQPLNRLHSNHGDRLPWEYPGQAEVIATDYLRLRGRLVPHLYTLSRESHDTGLPMNRALYLQWPEHQNAYKYPSQFTLGDDLLVATVAQPGTGPTVDLWVPPGTWYNYFDGSVVVGPAEQSVQVPLDQYPVFARAGSILPLVREQKPTLQSAQGPLTLMVWAGENGSYNLYEDQGSGFSYESGQYQITTIHTQAISDTCQSLTIEAAQGKSFKGDADSRPWEIQMMAIDEPSQVTIDGIAVHQGNDTPGWQYDATRRALTVNTKEIPTNTGTTIVVGSSCG